MRAVLSLTLMLALASCAMMAGRQAGNHPIYVFFAEGSARLDPAAMAVIAQASAQASASPGAHALVYGYTDSAGSPQADHDLSQRRAQHVADALAKAGVAPVQIVPEGQTGENPGVESRRVEIRIEH